MKRSDGRDLESFVNVILKDLAYGTPSPTCSPFENAISGYTVYAPWADVPAWALALIGWLSCHEAENRAIYEGPKDARGFCEYGADWLALKEVDGKWHAIVGQTKDHAKLKLTCLGRFFAIGECVRAFNREQAMPNATSISMALCYPEDTRISRGDGKHLETLQLSWGLECLCMEGFERLAPVEGELMPCTGTLVPAVVAPISRATSSQHTHAATMAKLEELSRPNGGKERPFQAKTARFVRDHRGISLIKGPPGIGKTFIMALIVGHLLFQRATRHAPKPTLVFFVAPHIDLCNQFCDKIAEILRVQFGNGWAQKLVKVYGHDGEAVLDRDALQARQESGARVFVATEKSCHRLTTLANFTASKNHPLLVLKDEAHWGSNDDSSSMELISIAELSDKKKNKNPDDIHRGVICTATPTQAARDACDHVALDMSMDDAVFRYKICRPYEIVLPLITDLSAIGDDNPPVDIKTLSTRDALGAGIAFTVDQLLYTGARRCIVYGRNTTEARQIIAYLEEACPLFGATCTSDLIVQGTKNRVQKYRSFATRATSSHDDERQTIHLQFLVAVQILDFGVDIPECDSISIPTPPVSCTDAESAHRFVQRMGRAMRGERGSAHVFLFASSTSPWLRMLSSALKEFDPDCAKRIHVRSANPAKKHSKTVQAVAKSTLASIVARFDFAGTRGPGGQRYERQKARVEAFVQQYGAQKPTTLQRGTIHYTLPGGQQHDVDAYTFLARVCHDWHLHDGQDFLPADLKECMRSCSWWSEPVVKEASRAPIASTMDIMQQLRDYHAEHGRLPTNGKQETTHAKHIGTWLMNFRNTVKREAKVKREGLDDAVVQAFMAWAEANAKLRKKHAAKRNAVETLKRCYVFFVINGRLPNKTATDVDERALGQFLSTLKQCKTLYAGTLAAALAFKAKVNASDDTSALVPEAQRLINSASGTSRFTSALERIQQFYTFFLKEQRLPREKAQDKDERRIVKFLHHLVQGDVGKELDATTRNAVLDFVKRMRAAVSAGSALTELLAEARALSSGKRKREMSSEAGSSSNAERLSDLLPDSDDDL